VSSEARIELTNLRFVMLRYKSQLTIHKPVPVAALAMVSLSGTYRQPYQGTHVNMKTNYTTLINLAHSTGRTYDVDLFSALFFHFLYYLYFIKF